MKTKTDIAFAFLAASIGVVILAECIGRPRMETASSPARRPNIVLILTDDLDHNLATIDKMPRLKEILAGQISF